MKPHRRQPAADRNLCLRFTAGLPLKSKNVIVKQFDEFFSLEILDTFPPCKNSNKNNNKDNNKSNDKNTNENSNKNNNKNNKKNKSNNKNNSKAPRRL